MSTKKKMLWLLSLLPFFIACGDDNTDIPDWPWAEPETPTEPVEANPDIVNLGWTNVKSTYGTLPEHINVYKSPETLEGKKAIAYIALRSLVGSEMCIRDRCIRRKDWIEKAKRIL